MAEEVSFLEEEKSINLWCNVTVDRFQWTEEDSTHCSEYCIHISKFQIKRVSDVKATDKKYLEIALNSEVTKEKICQKNFEEHNIIGKLTLIQLVLGKKLVADQVVL